MRELVEAPSEGDLGDVPVRLQGVGEVAPAMLQSLGEHIAPERRLLVRQERVGVTWRDPEGGGRPVE